MNNRSNVVKDGVGRTRAQIREYCSVLWQQERFAFSSHSSKNKSYTSSIPLHSWEGERRNSGYAKKFIPMIT